jgi:hypothetical protein
LQWYNDLSDKHERIRLMTTMVEKRRGPKPNPDSKRQKGENRHKNPRKAFHAEQEIFDAMERMIAVTRPTPTESSVLRDALLEYMEKRGFWPPPASESE